MRLQRILAPVMLAGLLATLLQAVPETQSGVAALPATIRHVFDPPGSPGVARFITAAADGSALVLTESHDRPSTDTQIWRVMSRGETRLLHQSSPNSYPTAALSPAPGGAYYGILRVVGSDSDPLGVLFRVTVDGAFELLHVFAAATGSGTPAQIRLGDDGTTYVSSYPGNVPQESATDVLVIRPDGTIVPKAFSAPGIVLAVDADGVAYGVASGCRSVCGLDLFRRRPDGAIEWLRRLASHR